MQLHHLIEKQEKLEGKKKDYSKVFGDKLRELARENEKIVAIISSMKDGTGLTKFSKEFPKRFFEIGIAEQHALGLAAGMAIGTDTSCNQYIHSLSKRI